MKRILIFLIGLSMLCGISACGNQAVQENESARVTVMNASEEEIYGIGYTYYVNGEVISSGGICNADNSVMKKGESFSLDNLPDAEVVELELSVQDKDGNEYPCTTIVTINKKSEEPYVIMISGDFKNGFIAEREL